MTNRPCVTQEEAARLMQCSLRWVKQQIAAGVLKAVDSGEKRGGQPVRKVVLESLPLEAQARWRAENQKPQSAQELEEIFIKQRERDKYRGEIAKIYAEMTERQRRAWVVFANHLRELIFRAEEIKPKKDIGVGGYVMWTPDFQNAALATQTNNPEILKRWPRFAKPVKPATLYNWIREYPERGDLVFLPPPTRGKARKADDGRRANVSKEVHEFIGANWTRFPGMRDLWEEVALFAIGRGEDPPSYAWVRKYVKAVPRGERALAIEGKKKFTDLFKTFTPRDYRDLEALEVVCGDHMMADVWVSVCVETADGRRRHIVVRPWVTSWQDLRTGLVWGYHVSFRPNTDTAIAAYMNGVRTWGAQPPGSWRYVDNGKDYRSKKMNGQLIQIHNVVETPDEPDLFVYVDSEICSSMADDLALKTMFADPYAAWQKVIERTHGDFHKLEMRHFWGRGYCGPTPEKRPDNVKELYKQHQKAVAKGKPSPFPTFEEYRATFAQIVETYNRRAHRRTTLGDAVVIPEVLFDRMYPVRYTLSQTAMEMMGMSAIGRTIQKGMVRLETLFFRHESLADHNGAKIEVRYTLDDLSKVVCRLPDGDWISARQVDVRGVLKTNFEEIRARREAETRERILLRQAQDLINHILSTESIEERIAVGEKRLKPVQQLTTRYDLEGTKTPTTEPAEIYQYRKPIGWQPGDDDFGAPVTEQPGVRPIFDPWALPEDEDDDAESADL